MLPFYSGLTPDDTDLASVPGGNDTTYVFTHAVISPIAKLI